MREIPVACIDLYFSRAGLELLFFQRRAAADAIGPEIQTILTGVYTPVMLQKCLEQLGSDLDFGPISRISEIDFN